MRSVALLILCITFVVGCDSAKPDPTETVVSGTVTLDGAPLTMGEVVIENTDGTKSARGEIASDGTFRVASSPLGNVKVAVRTSSYAQYAAAPKAKGGKAITVGNREGTYVPVPKHYEDTATSKLTYTIAKGGELKIELTSK